MTTERDTSEVVAALRGHERFLVTTHENPDGDALGLAARDAPRPAFARQGQRHVPRRRRAAARGVRLPRARRPRCASRRTTTRSACSSPSTARRRAGSRTRRCRVGAPLTVNIDHHHDNTRFGDVNLVVPEASSTGEVLADLVPGARRPADARAGRAALHRARHRHGPLPVREHDAEGAAAGGRPGRGRRRRPQGLPGRLRDRSVREAEAARTRARAGPRVRGRPGRRLLPAPQRLPGRSAPPSPTPRESSTTSARSRARSWRR